MATEGREDSRIRWTTLGMATLAATALEQAVLEPGRSRAAALGFTVALTTPAIAASWVLARRTGSPDGRASGNLRVPAGAGALAALLAVFALPFGFEAARLVMTGRCSMPEVTLIAALRNLGLGLAAMAYRPAFARLSALVSLFLVTVASPVGGEGGLAVLAPVGGFAAVGTLWLMLVYWQGLGLKATPGGKGRRFPIAGAAWVLVVVAMFAALAAIGPSRAATALAGLVPTSGGTDWSDPDARSGVGDGDHEVSASEHPQSVGFSESEVYLESDRPSLYDAFNESYGEPFKPKRQEKMIALGQQDIGEQMERPAENLQAGREFPAVRRKPQPHPKRPGERAAKALVYVKGPTPLHIPLTSYSHFDGTTWREEPCCQREFPAEPEPKSTWLKLPWSEAAFLAGIVSHQVKIGTLDSSAMPVPPHLTRFRVGSFNRLDFFAWAQFGIVRMTDRTVPAGTVIDSEARTVDPLRLRSVMFWPRPGYETDHHISFHGEYKVAPAVAALAREWVAGVPKGWCQVDAVINALRRGYEHDRMATATAECTDVVAEFLLRSRRGPDYLFSSSVAVLLRSLGYPTRVVSGLYVSSERYDARTRHTPVTREDVHFWAEVRMPNGAWVAVEPTRGFELMPPIRPWSERFALALVAAGRWALAHALELLAGILAIVVVVICRRELLDRLLTLAFWLSPAVDSRRRVLRALGLVERRACWAGSPRPPGLTLARWYRPVARTVGGESGSVLEGLVRLADWAIYAPPTERAAWPPSPDPSEIEQTCRSVVRAWTLARFRITFGPRPRTGATT